MAHRISSGFDDSERAMIAALYWEAFAQKLAMPMGPSEKAQRFIARHLDPDFALVARDPKGRVQGVAGFKTADGALINGGIRDLAAIYGWASTLWRAPLLALVERNLAADVLLMDGICVAQAARGSGLGTALLSAIKQTARARGCSHVRLDVIDTNTRAHALYLREGFRDIGTHHLGPLRHVFGFSASHEMCCAV